MQISEVVRAYFDAVNNERWDELRKLFTEDAVYHTMGTAAREGRDAVMELYERRLFTAWAEHHDKPGRTIVEGDGAAVEIRFTGTTHDGRQVSFDAVDIFWLRDGRISALTTWYDVGPVRAALSAGSR